ncbi:MAG: histidine ammonia-lyase [bacterium]|nr:histidine ammonia-lyase [bacterium]
MGTDLRTATGEPFAIVLDGTPFSFEQLDTAFGRPLQVTVADEVRQRVGQSRTALEQHLAKGDVIYGVNTGFGKLCDKRISNEQLAQLQENLILSHAVGVGPPVPDELVRWMLLFKIQALALGCSGIRPDTLETLVKLLNADLLPRVPTRGSLGASGDLAPLAHLSLALIGVGTVAYEGTLLPAGQALADHGIEPLRLEAKEGLALINGTQLMLAYAAGIVVLARRLAKQADIIAAMSLDATQGSLRPFDERLLALRPHRGAMEVGANVRRLMADSEILVSHATCGKLQDPYSLRCIPQVHGACRDALRHTADTVLIELDSVTDNPIVIGDEIISGGLFHGEPLALTLDYLAMALTEWASISERRIYQLLSGSDGLPALLMKDTGLNSGFMIPQYTAAALVNECKVLSHPACTDSIPTSLGQEDHVSMGAQSALKCLQILENVETVLAIEVMCAAQALDYRLPTKPGVGPRVALEVVRQTVPHAEQDRLFGEDIQAILALLRRRDITTSIESALGELT